MLHITLVTTVSCVSSCKQTQMPGHFYVGLLMLFVPEKKNMFVISSTSDCLRQEVTLNYVTFLYLIGGLNIQDNFYSTYTLRLSWIDKLEHLFILIKINLLNPKDSHVHGYFTKTIYPGLIISYSEFCCEKVYGQRPKIASKQVEMFLKRMKTTPRCRWTMEIESSETKLKNKKSSRMESRNFNNQPLSVTIAVCFVVGELK